MAKRNKSVPRHLAAAYCRHCGRHTIGTLWRTADGIVYFKCDKCETVRNHKEFHGELQ